MTPLRMISSMATRQVLAELIAGHERAGGGPTTLEAVGGVDAARRVQEGEAFDIVTARAVSALPKLLRLTVPLTRHGGEIIALKGSKAQEEIDDSKNLMKKLDIHSFEIVFTGALHLEEPTRVVRTRLF